MRAGPRFLSQLTTRMSVRRARADSARFWNGSRLVDLARLTRSLRSIWRQKLLVLSWISGGISHGFGAQSESTWSLGLNTSSETRGLPEMYTFVWKYFLNRAKDSGILRLGRRGTGINFSPSPMMFLGSRGRVL